MRGQEFAGLRWFWFLQATQPLSIPTVNHYITGAIRMWNEDGSRDLCEVIVPQWPASNHKYQRKCLDPEDSFQGPRQRSMGNMIDFHIVPQIHATNLIQIASIYPAAASSVEQFVPNSSWSEIVTLPPISTPRRCNDDNGWSTYSRSNRSVSPST